MMRGTKIALFVVTAPATISSLLFLKQGGFGGGHGDFDMILFILGLPWVGVPWPELFTKHDFVWLIGLPLALNLACVFIASAIFGSVRRRQHGHS